MDYVYLVEAGKYKKRASSVFVSTDGFAANDQYDAWCLEKTELGDWVIMRRIPVGVAVEDHIISWYVAYRENE